MTPEQLLKNLRQYYAMKGYDLHAEPGDKELVGLGHGSIWGPCITDGYDAYELAEAVEKWLHERIDAVLAGDDLPTTPEAVAAAEHQYWFAQGAQACREMMARFVASENQNTAASIRANWHPGWGPDPGKLDGPIPTEPKI